MNTILSVRNIEVKFYNQEGVVNAVNGSNFELGEGSAVGIVGESGCGKSVTALSILHLLSRKGRITSGQILLNRGEGNSYINIVDLDPEGSEMRKIRGGDISMIFQEPMSSFSPVHTVGNQIKEGIIEHQGLGKERAHEKAVDLLRQVDIPSPEQRVNEYPFQLSGGMCQRAMIALALSCEPRILIADEPTTSLDVTTQAQVLNLISDLRKNKNLSLILITHDLGVIAHMVERVCVMYLGSVVEAGSRDDIFHNPKHPYTRALLRSIPKLTISKEKRVDSIEGSVPDAYNMPSGCAFNPRCEELIGRQCRNGRPDSVEVAPGHIVSCFMYE